MSTEQYGTWLEIDLEVLRSNYLYLKEQAGVEVMPIVKANAYGHGLERVAMELDHAGASWLGIARVEEALFLRELDVNANLLVLGYTPPVRVSDAIKNDISLTVYDPGIAQDYSTLAANEGKAIKLHAKIDTGMGRLGVPVDRALDFLSYLEDEEYVELEGIFTHFACADEPEKDVTGEQINKFKSILRDFKAMGYTLPLIHSANSAGLINFPDAKFDMARAGIALYGHPPSHETTLIKGIKPAILWKTRLISIKELPQGHGVSYGHQYHTKSKERIGVIAVGYGDGFRRVPGNHVLIRGKKADIVGNVCMDQCMVQLESIPEAKIGDEVVVMGLQDSAEISATDIADDWDTINYEIICGLAARMPRIYLHSKQGE